MCHLIDRKYESSIESPYISQCLQLNWFDLVYNHIWVVWLDQAMFVCLACHGWCDKIWLGLGWVWLGLVLFGLVWFCFGLVWFVSDNVRQVQWCLAFGSFVKANLYKLAFVYFKFYIVWFGLV